MTRRGTVVGMTQIPSPSSAACPPGHAAVGQACVAAPSPTPNPYDLVGFHLTPLQIVGAGAICLLIVVVIFSLAAKAARGGAGR